LKYKRVLIKLSGESLAGGNSFGFDNDTVANICSAIKKASETGTQIAIVVGGGNIWRGREHPGMDHTRADQMGMLATVINAMSIADTLRQMGVETRVQTALQMPQVSEPFVRDKAVRHLEKGRVVIFACGTGSPYFSTDTGAALRAAEIGADIVLKATMVDGVYNKDPHKFDDAVKYEKLDFTTVLSMGLGVIDSTAASLCKDNGLKLLVFSIDDPENIVKAINGETIGTIIEEEK